MSEAQLEQAAACLNMTLDAARTHSRPLGEALLVWSDRRGVGSVLVADDLSVLFFNSSVPPRRALEELRSGRRTPMEKFRVFREDGGHGGH